MLDFNDRILKSGGILLSRWGENRTTQRSWAIKMRVRHKYSKCQRDVDSLEQMGRESNHPTELGNKDEGSAQI